MGQRGDCAPLIMAQCGAPTARGPCGRQTKGGRCWQHPGTEVAVPGAGDTVRITPYAVDFPAQIVTPRQSVVMLLQVSWQRWQSYATMLENEVTSAQPGQDGNGLVVPTYGSNPKDGMYVSGEAISALALLEAQERDRCAKLAKQAHDMGIDDSEWLS